MRSPLPRSAHTRLTLSIPVVVALVAILSRTVSGSEVGAALGDPVAPPAPRAEIVNNPARTDRAATGEALRFDSLMGRSRRVLVRLVSHDDVMNYPGLIEHFGNDVLQPGIRSLPGAPNGSRFSFITLMPWTRKLGAEVNGYRVGWWPGERRAMPTNYDNPVGFVEVTPLNVSTQLSEHFRLQDFVTHDQPSVWPKYVVLREDLLDKLELVLETLQGEGIPASRATVLSGFRTPQYNQRGFNEGMAFASRHQYGDAADIVIDSNGDGRMDDLNRDGVVDFRDTDVINRAVERVEWRFPDLVGGLGLYHAMGPSGPFAHIDVRGERARWTNNGNSRARPASRWEYVAAVPNKATGKCQAEGAMAILCTGMR
ncbi:MAG: hypothetical protein MNPFHGCM_02798 [Gemmatimonadaceae bacterium]|nr:hypothetical protein [Gemmatimonadaceae bacterium]